MSRVRSFVASCALLCACGDAGLELSLAIREPADRRLFAGIASLQLRAERDDRAIADSNYPPSTDRVLITDVPYGPRTVFVLEGTTAAGDVTARGRTCPFDFTAPDGTGPRSVALSFAPTHFFAPTIGVPQASRAFPAVWPLPSGDVLVAGGTIAGTTTDSVEMFSVQPSTFTLAGTMLGHARSGAETTVLSFGTLISGGLDGNGSAVVAAELFRPDTGLFTSIENTALGARADHRAVLLDTERVLLTGGSPSSGAPALQTTTIVRFQTDGSATVSVGPTLTEARRAHAALVVSGVPVLIGGYGVDGAPLASIEAFVADDSALRGHFSPIATLKTPRAEATATLLTDGTILVVGGAGDAAGTPLMDAEVYNPITELTTVYLLGAPRRGHSATLLPDGRVLIAGGVGATGTALDLTELFLPGVGFVSERPLLTPRVGHRAIPLCDDTVLVVGGGDGAEVYTPPP